MHPYNTDAFEHLLNRHDLAKAYPRLINNLRYGFPLSNMPVILQSIIFLNHPSCTTHISAVNDYLTEELAVGRMSGPFSKLETERILRGPFQSSPLIVSVQPQQPGTPDKLRVCQHLSKGSRLHPSVNSFIEKANFPTQFDTAMRVAEIVSLQFNIVILAIQFNLQYTLHYFNTALANLSNTCGIHPILMPSYTNSEVNFTAASSCQYNFFFFINLIPWQ